MTRLSALLKKTNTASHKVFHPPITLYYCEAEHYPITSKLHFHTPFVFLKSHRLLCPIMNGISSD